MQNKLSKTELNDIIQWDVKTWSKVLPFWEKHFSIKPGMKVLAIGEREGGLSMWFAKKGCSVTCTDYNDFPDTTKDLHKDYKVAQLINYELNVDATDLSRFDSNSYDIVVFKSVIGVLSEKDRQQTAIKEMHRVLKKDGALLFAENLKGTKLHSYLRKKFVRWDSYWRYLDLKKDKDLFDSFTKKEFKAIGFSSNFGRSEGQKSFLSKMDSGLVWMTPKTWRYVLFGVLIK